MQFAEFAELLKAGRKMSDLTQEELAEQVDRQFKAVLDWEKGRYAPPYETVLAVADALGIDRGRLVKAAGYETIVEVVEQVTPMSIEDAIDADTTLSPGSRTILRGALAAARAEGTSVGDAQRLQDAEDDHRMITETLDREDPGTS